MKAQSDEKVRDSVDHLFRHQSGQMVSVLTRIFGIDKLELVEDAVQDSLVTALRKWPYRACQTIPQPG